jgi:hypothetical protein
VSLVSYPKNWLYGPFETSRQVADKAALQEVQQAGAVR